MYLWTLFFQERRWSLYRGIIIFHQDFKFENFGWHVSSKKNVAALLCFLQMKSVFRHAFVSDNDPQGQWNISITKSAAPRLSSCSMEHIMYALCIEWHEYMVKITICCDLDQHAERFFTLHIVIIIILVKEGIIIIILIIIIVITFIIIIITLSKCQWI